MRTVAVLTCTVLALTPPPRPSEVGRYRHDFEMARAWRGKRVFLVFEGAMTDTEAWIVGVPRGLPGLARAETHGPESQLNEAVGENATQLMGGYAATLFFHFGDPLPAAKPGDR